MDDKTGYISGEQTLAVVQPVTGRWLVGTINGWLTMVLFLFFGSVS